MKPIPPPETLASLVSGVTQTMLGMSFSMVTNADAAPSCGFRTALLPIPGAFPVTVVLASDEPSCAALAAGMFSVAQSDLDPTMIDDMLSELANITAGRIQSSMKLEQALGLPKIFASGAPMPDAALHRWKSIQLKAGQVNLSVGVAVPAAT